MKVGIFGSEYQADKQNLIRRLFDKLQALEAEVYVDNTFYMYLTDALDFEPEITGLITNNDVEFEHELDFVLSLGGDGTFLHTAARVNKQNIPILGINTGRLGFLADVSVREIEETLEELYRNYYKIEERRLLQLSANGHPFKGFNYALNEVAILKRDTSSMIIIHTHLNGEYLTSYQADGLVIATPTGSTAYSMSINGPIMIPQCDNLILSPVAPHSLNVRPLVIPDNYTISLGVESRNKTFLVALDGRSEVFPTGIQLTVKIADYTTKIIKRHNHTFYQTLRDKLMWGVDARKKGL